MSAGESDARRLDQLESQAAEIRRKLELVVDRVTYWLDQPGGIERLREAMEGFQPQA